MLLTIAFPVYNEEEIIDKVISETTDFVNIISKQYDFDWEILAVNDGSKDKSGELLREIQKRIPKLRVVSHPKNLGYRAAVQSCLTNSHGDFVVVIDSDGQYIINDLPKFIEKTKQGYELVLGNKIKRNDPQIRILLGKGYNFMFRLFFGIKLKEVDCGFRLLSKDLAKRIHLGEGNLPIGPEIAVIAVVNKFRIAEVPVSHHLRKSGKTVFPISKLPQVILQAFIELVKLKIQTKKTKIN